MQEEKLSVFNRKKYQFVPTNEGDVAITPYTDQKQQFALNQCIGMFHSLGPFSVNLEKHQKILHSVWQKYDSFQIELASLHQLLDRLNQTNNFKLLPIKLLYNPITEPVQKLANKLKLLYSKGRKGYNLSQVHVAVDNCMQRCEKYHKKYDSITFNKKSIKRQEKFDQLMIIKKRFDILNPQTAFYYANYPLQQLPKATKFMVSFYTQNLLLRPQKKIQFNKNLLYCPVIIEEDDELKVAPQYLQQLNEYLKDWENKGLTIDVMKNGKVMTSSYLRIQYSRDTLVEQLTLIRDKVFQLMIFNFIQEIMHSKKNMLFLKTSNPYIFIRVSMSTIPKDHKLYTGEYISTVLSILRNDKLQQMDSQQILYKIQYSVEELFISKKMSSYIYTILPESKPEFTKYLKKIGQTQNILITAQEMLVVQKSESS